jgi:hypothetical protein
MGASAYHIIQNYQSVIEGDAIVEIGSARGEGSTDYFIQYAKDHKKHFYTIDVRQDVVDFFQGKQIQNFSAICCETIDFIEQIQGPLCFVYMDSFDYIPPDDSIKHDWMQQMIAEYKARHPNDPSQWLTNENSARHHLERTISLLPLMSDKSIFLFDDTFVPAHLENVGWFKNSFDPDSNEYHQWFGKGATAVPYLLDKGWNILPKTNMNTRDDYTSVANFIL